MAQGQSEAQQSLQNFWPKVTEDIQNMTMHDLKQQELPLARIKKIMKLDEDVKMISAEAPVLFAKAAEIFIHELTLRAWVHTEDNKRRTLQRNDIAMAITKFDQFDFLIDIVPREDIKPTKSREDGNVRTTSMPADQVQYYFQLAQQHQAALQQTPQPGASTSANQGAPTIQIVQPGGQVQTLSVVPAGNGTSSTGTVQVADQASITTTAQQVLTPAAAVSPPVQANAGQASAQIIQLHPHQVQNQTAPQTQQGGIQIVQQIIAPNGEIQQIPIQLTPQQLQMIRMQIQGSTNQPIIIQTAPIQAIQQPTVVSSQSQPQIIQVASQGQSGTPVYLTQASQGGPDPGAQD